MKIQTALFVLCVALFATCASEFEISASDVPDNVMKAFKEKYSAASDVEWEAEKMDGKLYFEAEFKLNGKTKEAYFRPDGTFTKEE